MTRVLVWQWGRRGGGLRYAVQLAEALRSLPGTDVALSLSRRAELMHGPTPLRCELPVETYGGLVGFAGRVAIAPLTLAALVRCLRALRPDVAVCAMPGPLDLLMATALRQLGVPFVAVVHDAQAHPGDGLPLQIPLQRALCRRASGLVALCGHVARQVRSDRRVGPWNRPFLLSRHPPMVFDPPPPPPFGHGGRIRLLSFGRLLKYKGLDLLVDTLRLLGPAPHAEFRLVGGGPETPTLAALRALPGVSVENRWVPEEEIGALLGWADALVLSYTEATQSGVAAAAVAAGRRIVATRVGGLPEQLRDTKLATLCQPDALELAATLRGLIDTPGPQVEPVDATAIWQQTAAELLHWLETEIQ
jgi:glycosyltransferase involved in cell wall biosynthesis